MKRKFSNFILLAAVALICLLLLPTEAKAASVEDLTFALNRDGASYTVSGCDTSASGELVIPGSHNDLPVTKIGYRAFNDCTSLTSITIPEIVASIGDSAFSYCSSLTSVTIPDSVTSIGSSAFEHCYSLTSINIPDSVTSIGDSAFSYCASLTSVTIGNSVTSIGSSAFEECYSLTSINIPDSVTSIGDSAFFYCSGLTSVTIGNSVTSIGSSAFEECYSLTSINIPDSVTSIGDYAFYHCTDLTSIINIPDSVTSIGDSAFSYCYGLTSITIPDSVTSVGDYAFYSCESLTGIWVDSENPNYSSDSCGVLFNKDQTELIQAPGSIRGAYTVPDSVTSIGYNAFHSCASLTSITIPDSVTSIGESAFTFCGSLTNITIPDSVTSIGNDTFDFCTSLTSITIPDSVTSIGESAFYGCTSLTDVYYYGSEAQWNAITIESYNDRLLNATIYFADPCADGHTYDESGNCACGATRATVTVADDEVIVNANETTGIKVFAFNITDKDIADINAWGELKAADPSFKTYTKSSFTLKNGTYVLRVQYNDAAGVTNAVSYEVTVDYTPEPVEGPAITVENNTVSVTNNGMSNVRVFAFNITGKEVADINVWNQLKAADPKVKTYTKSSFTLKNGDYVLRVQYTDAEGVTHTESHEVTVNVESVIPQATISGKSVAVDGKGTTVTKIHAFYVEGKEISDANNWNALKAADSAFKSYKNSQFSLRNIGAYVLRIEFVDQYGIAQKVSQAVTAE